MIQGLLAAVAVILRFAFLFGIYYLIKGLLLSFKDDILYSGTCSLRAAGAGICEESEK